jgi:hypothetical protein
MMASTVYQIRVRGHLAPRLSAWFGDLQITHTPEGDTLLTGTIIDQAALHGILIRCRDLGVTLIAINPLSMAPTAPHTVDAVHEEQRENQMNTLHIEVSEVIDARAEDLYAIVSDYHVGHPAILPKPYFTELTVLKGGKGAGTELRGMLKVFGQSYPFRQEITEPEPGRLMKETDLDNGVITFFKFEPLNGGKQTRVSIISDFPLSRGFMGLMERLTKPSVVRTIYKKELKQLAAYVRTRDVAVRVGSV